jgi:hypothetical protein
MKSIIVILALAMALTSAFAVAEEADEEVTVASEIEEVTAEETVTLTNAEETATAECFVDEDGDEICDTCGKTAEECAAEAVEGKCATCESCGDENGE